jgi:hypothetical protein
LAVQYWLVSSDQTMPSWLPDADTEGELPGKPYVYVVAAARLNAGAAGLST